MEFKDIFREKYRAALHAARAGDERGVLNALKDLDACLSAQFYKDNGDPILVKAKLSHWHDVCSSYIKIVREFGLADPRIRKFFGLPEEDIAPFGESPAARPSGNRDGGIDITGIIPPETDADDADPASPQPKEPMPALPVEIPADDAEDEDGAEGAEEPQDEGGPEPSAEEPKDEEGPKDADELKDEDEPLPAGETVALPAYEPDSLENFIGQQHIVKVLLKEIAIAKAEGKHHLDNILLFGNPGLGKSTLMRLIAKALGVRFEWMDCSQYRNSQQSLKALQGFLMKVARENEPVVIAFDEVHMLTDELQSSLLTLLESRVYVSPPDVKGHITRIPIEEFTFIAATTDDDKVLNTIKDRCLRLKFQMVDYTSDELKQIYRTKVAAKGLTITEEAIEVCIPRSRGSIRYVNSFVEGLDRELYDENGKRLSTHIDLAAALHFFEERGIDPIGLEKKDLEILRAIEEETSGVIGAETLSARVGLDPKKYASEYEPYLVKIGFISVTGRGRSLTEKAREYLKKA